MKAITDEQIKELAEEYGLGVSVEPDFNDSRDFIWFDQDIIPFTRAVLALQEKT